MKRTPKLLLIIAGLAMVGSGLRAQDLKYGLHASVALPLGDIAKTDYLDDELGFGVGANMIIGFPRGHAIVPRLDYSYFKKSDPTRKVQMLQIGADYNYFISGQTSRGFYVGGGLGYGKAKFATDSVDDTPGNYYLSASAGCMFTQNLGAEVRYSWAKYEPEFRGYQPEVTSPIIQASFIYRF